MKNLMFWWQLATYYFMVAVFSLLSYGLLWIVYGETGISLLEWFAIMGVAFTVGYIPILLQRRKKRM